MAVPPPDARRLAELAGDLGLTSADLEEFAPAVAATFASSEAVEALYRRTAPIAPSREWHAGAHPLGAWYVTTEISDPAATDGPLVGRTVAIKDNVSVAGVPMMNGSATVEGFVPVRDATAVQRLLAAGAVITGKSVCEDLCFSGASFTSKPAAVRNPWDSARNAGGSSSGSAVLVATGEVDLALGGDQGGSVRIPSSFCGTVGHKPTFGLVPYTGAFPIEQTIDHLGPITRTVADAALMLGVLAGPDGQDPRQPTVIDPVDYTAVLDESAAGLRVGVVTQGFGHPHSDPGVDAAVRAAVDVLRGAGLSVGEVSIPWHLDAMHVWNVIATEGAAHQMIDGNAYGMNWSGLYDPELIAHYRRGRAERGAELSKTVKLVAMSGRHTLAVGGGAYYAMAQNLVPEARSAYDAALAEFDVLVMPTLPYTAREIPAPDGDLGTYLDTALSMITNTAPFDVTGHPACSVPTDLVDGLPAGLMIVGRHFADATVLRVAHAYEQARGGFPAPPTLTTTGAPA
ncbi:amidase [Pseudonocardia sp. RS11V-5]|uniref:amidase n=1 Tax=Pseudonocardia terrae TaxID=2905831 RepID=UPI001E462854|nr:amidase [Pseudonocardia terrae]MCE3554628.1 amidase [Pseudonocardia terrae]